MKPSKELAALRKDRERIDYLDSKGQLSMSGRYRIWLSSGFRAAWNQSLRQALDSAMRQSRGAK